MLDFDPRDVRCFYCRNNESGFCRYFCRKIKMFDWIVCSVWH